MSTSKGSSSRTRPQKHKNKTAFKNDLHDKSKKNKMLNSLEVKEVCKRCKDIIDWKIKYKKYKPLTAPAKCVDCGEKVVKYAYHVLCSKCASEKSVCAKCCKPSSSEEDQIQTNSINTKGSQSVELLTALKSLPERKRRTVLRYLNKHDLEQSANPEVMALIEDLLAGTKISLEDNDFNFSDDGFDDDSDEESDNK